MRRRRGEANPRVRRSAASRTLATPVAFAALLAGIAAVHAPAVAAATNPLPAEWLPVANPAYEELYLLYAEGISTADAKADRTPAVKRSRWPIEARQP